MRIELDDDVIRVRDELRAHIAANRPSLRRLPGTRSPRREDLAEFRAWCASLFEGGFLGHDWPVEWGGAGRLDPVRELVVDQELANADVPRPVGAYNLVAGPLMEFGTPEQQRYYLPRIRRFDDLWCQLFSEPSAGSDLAALRTRARKEGDHWIIDGQKVWTTHGHVADLGFLLARTDPTVSKHAGITAFIVDMGSPGIDVRPLREITGSTDFNEVFFDGVAVPGANVLGEIGQGWSITRAALAHERTQAMREDSVVDAAQRLVALASRERLDGVVPWSSDETRRRIGRLAARAWVTDQLGVQGVLAAARGEDSDPVAAAVMKLVFSELNLEISTLGVDLQGAAGVIVEGDEHAVDHGHWQESFLWARGYTISAGSNEIMKNVIAERGLGMPREVQPARTEA